MRIEWIVAGAVAITLAVAHAASDARAAICDMLRGETVTFIVPYSAGGGYDTLARLLEPHLEQYSGAEVVVSNVTGAGGMTGSKAIRDARPDGRTLGIVSGSSLLLEMLLGDKDAPSLTGDYRLIGQLTSDARILVAAAGGPVRRIDDLWAGPAAARPAIGVVNPRGVEALMANGLARLLGLDLDVVSGFRGGKDSGMALLRGDIDVMPRTFESALPAIASGEMRPLLQLTDRPIRQAAVSDVPVLGGAAGTAAQRAAELGRPVDEAVEEAGVYIALGTLNRLVVGPNDLEPAVADCLDGWFAALVSDPGFLADVAAAGRTLEPEPGTAVQARVERLMASASEFLPTLREALAQTDE